MRKRLLGLRGAAIVSALVSLAIFAGCMSLQFGGDRHEEVVSEPPARQVSFLPGDGLLEQAGDESVGDDHAVLDVYYPVPYISPPHLTVSSSFDEVHIIEQRRDLFRVKNTGSFVQEFHWKANGVKVLLNAPPVVVTPPVEAPAPKKLPAEPVPVSEP